MLTNGIKNELDGWSAPKNEEEEKAYQDEIKIMEKQLRETEKYLEKLRKHHAMPSLKMAYIVGWNRGMKKPPY